MLFRGEDGGLAGSQHEISSALQNSRRAFDGFSWQVNVSDMKVNRAGLNIGLQTGPVCGVEIKNDVGIRTECITKLSVR